MPFPVPGPTGPQGSTGATGPAGPAGTSYTTPFAYGFGAVASGSTTAMTANRLWFVVALAPVTGATKMGIYLPTGAGNVYVAVYSSAYARKAISASTATASGYQEIPFLASVNIVAGDFLAVVSDDGATTIGYSGPASSTATDRGYGGLQTTAFPPPNPLVPTSFWDTPSGFVAIAKP